MRILSYPTRILLLVCMLAAPWFWGAWEVWWFWPFAFGIFFASALLGLRWVVEACGADETDRRERGRGNTWLPAFLFLPFLAYALVRSVQAEVRMDAERSLLLFAVPLLLAAGILASFRRSDTRALLTLILADLFLLGLYGVWNHLRTGSQTVLGRPGFPQYYLDDRASGSYFCPDHYSGLLELALCLALPILSVRDRRWGSKLFAVLTCVLAILGIALSKSRGGGLAVLVILAAWLAWGFLEWPARWRWGLRIVSVACAAAILTGACLHKPEYVHRFVQYFGWSPADGRYVRSEKLIDVLRRQDRAQYWGAAYRAWREHPWMGIGPGMHQSLSPHYAATSDGDRKTGKWPTFPNYSHHVDMVHNDWLQLLEEYGAAGFLLFLVPAIYLPFVWIRQLYREGAGVRASGAEPSGNMVPVCAALLAAVAMAFHSLGDFNLQIPATGWLFAGILGVGWLHSQKRTEGIDLEAGARE